MAIPRASHVTEVLDTGGRSLRHTEAQEVRDVMLANLERPASSFFAVAITGPVPIDSQAYHVVLEGLSLVAANEPYIDQTISYLTQPDARLVSDDRRATFFPATIAKEYTTNAGQVTPRLRDAIDLAARRITGAEEYEILVTGGPALDFDSRTVSAEDAKRGERRSLLPTTAVLVLACGAIPAAILPVIIGLFAISCALAAVHVAASFHSMSIFVLTIVTMVGLAVGIDYSLLMVTRFRGEMNRGKGPTEATVRTLVTAGRAVVTSGLTVIVGFATLLLTPIIETRSVGIGGVLVVTGAVMLAVTLLPASLAVLGRSIDWPQWLARRLAWYHRPTAWERWARWLSVHPTGP